MARNKYPEDKRNSPFASALRNLMDERGTTQEDLARITCKTRQTVSQYANGISEPGYDTLVKIANYFDVSADYLLGISADPSRKPCAADELGLSPIAVDSIKKLSADERNGLDSFLSSNLLQQICRQISMYIDIPGCYKLSASNDAVGQYSSAGKAEEFIENAVIQMYPEMRGKFTVCCGINYAEQIKQQVLIAVEMMLIDLGWRQKEAAAPVLDD